jgi:hypothetical protein
MRLRETGLDLPIDLSIGRNSEFPQSCGNDEGVSRNQDPCPRKEKVEDKGKKERLPSALSRIQSLSRNLPRPVAGSTQRFGNLGNLGSTKEGLFGSNLDSRLKFPYKSHAVYTF